MKKRRIALVIILSLALIPTYAETVSNKQSQLNSAKKHIEDSKEELSLKQEEREAVQAEIKKIDQQMVTIQDRIAELEKELTDKQAELEEKEAQLEEAVKKKDEQYEDTKNRMVQMYKNQSKGYVQLIFSADNFWEALNRVEYIKRISKQDNRRIKEYEAQVKAIEKQKQEIEDEKAELNILHEAQIAKEKELEEQKALKDKAVAKLLGEENQIQAEIDDMEKISNELEKEIQELLAEEKRKAEAAAAAARNNSSSAGTTYTGGSPVTYSGGQFLWPVPGYYSISSEYNPRTSPISGKSEFHTGIDIPAAYGSDVVAAADGVVISSGWINGYGNTIMINHGSGIVTLYGHNSSLVVSTGQTVTKGQTVAKIGSTGYSTGNHCHFEVRINGSHTSPWNYLSN